MYSQYLHVEPYKIVRRRGLLRYSDQYSYGGWTEKFAIYSPVIYLFVSSASIPAGKNTWRRRGRCRVLNEKVTSNIKKTNNEVKGRWMRWPYCRQFFSTRPIFVVTSEPRGRSRVGKIDDYLKRRNDNIVHRKPWGHSGRYSEDLTAPSVVRRVRTKSEFSRRLKCTNVILFRTL